MIMDEIERDYMIIVKVDNILGELLTYSTYLVCIFWHLQIWANDCILDILQTLGEV